MSFEELYLQIRSEEIPLIKIYKWGSQEKVNKHMERQHAMNEDPKILQMWGLDPHPCFLAGPISVHIRTFRYRAESIYGQKRLKK